MKNGLVQLTGTLGFAISSKTPLHRIKPIYRPLFGHILVGRGVSGAGRAPLVAPWTASEMGHQRFGYVVIDVFS